MATHAETATVTIPVDPETARVYEEAPDQIRRRIGAMLRLQIHAIMNPEKRALLDAMDRLGAEAEANGLTPEILEDILRERRHG